MIIKFEKLLGATRRIQRFRPIKHESSPHSDGLGISFDEFENGDTLDNVFVKLLISMSLSMKPCDSPCATLTHDSHPFGEYGLSRSHAHGLDQARHLMLLTKNNAALTLLFDLKLLDHGKTEVLFGSDFPGDGTDVQVNHSYEM